MQVHTQPEVQTVFDQYPEEVRAKMVHLRQLILETAEETEGIDQLEESLKWGEPSYRSKIGSTIRIDWKAKAPDQYAMYFQCSTQLVPTFRKVYEETFEFEGSRAIVFPLDQPLPEAELKRCIATGLKYHKLKSQPLLGL